MSGFDRYAHAAKDRCPKCRRDEAVYYDHAIKSMACRFCRWRER